MADLDRLVVDVEIDVSTKNADGAIRQAGQLGAAMDKLADAQHRTANSNTKATAAQDRAAQAKARAEAAALKFQRQVEAENRALGAHEAAQNAAAAAAGGLTASQLKAIDAYAAATRAGNDNAAAVEKQGSAYKAAGKFVAEHPVLVLAGSVAAARALSGLSVSAAASLATASAATARFAAGSAEMGGAVAAGATFAARGLGVASTAAGVAATGFAAYAEKVAGLTTMTGLLSRGLGVLPGILGPIGLAFVAFELGSAAISKAWSDLDKLIALGERSQRLDLAAPFVKSFDTLGAKIRATVDEMQAALQRASGFVKDQFNEQNRLSKLFDEISATGVAGADGLKARSQLTEASTTEARIRAALSAMKELDDLGLHLASLKIGEAVFGSDFVERMRTANMSAEQIVAALEAAGQKELLKQEQVDRAVELNRKIEDTKQAIADAVAVTFDFSAAATLASEAWLKILQGVQWVIEKVNEANQASADFVGTLTTKMIGGLKTAGDYATDLLAKYGVIAKSQAEAAKTADVVLPTITAVQRHDVSGPTAPSFQQATAGAKQAQQAATEAASAYDNLLQRTQDRIKELDLETQSVGKTTDAVIKMKLAHDLERAAQKSGITVTADMRSEWDKLGTTLATSTNNLADSKRALENTREAQRELSQDFSQFAEDVVLGGKKMSEAFAGLSKTFASGSLKALLTGEGGLAGFYGTAPTERGGVGGVLGGKFDLSSLFPSREVREAVFGGARSGITEAFDPLLKPRTSAEGKALGFMSSPLGGALAAGAAGASVGYSSRNPLLGGGAGALAGFMTGDPIAAVAGGVLGFIGGSYGHSPSRKKDRANERRKRLREFASCGDADGLQPLHA